MKFITIYIILITFLFEVECKCTTVANSSVWKLKDDLLCDYDKEKMPVNKKKQPVHIFFMNIVKHVVWEDNKRNSLKINCVIGASWNNQELMWNPTEYQSVKSIYIPSTAIWTPVIEVIDINGSNKLLEDATCQIRWNGMVSCSTSVMIKAECKFEKVKYWPKDELYCETKLSTVPYENNTLSIKYFTFLITLKEAHNRSANWRVKDVAQDIQKIFVKNRIVYNIKNNFTFTRIAKGLSASVILPGISLSTINMVISFIKPTGKERLTLTFTNFLIHLIFLLNTYWITPYTSELPIIYVFTIISFFLATIGLYIGIVLKLMLSKEMCMPPLWLITLSRMIYTKYGKFLNIDKDSDVTMYVRLQTITKEEKTDRLLIKQILDKIYFITCLFTYLLLIFIVFCMYVSN